jgi:rRNA processing protein Krr1/Pno1
MIKDFVFGLDIKLPADMFGAIVGKGGATVRKIEEDSGASVVVHNNRNNNTRDRDANCKVTLKGPSKSVQAAKAIVDSIIEENTKEVVKVPYNTDFRPYLIQPNMADLNQMCPLERIRVDSGCARVEAVRNEANISITGKKEAIEEAVRMLNEILAKTSNDLRQISFDGVLFTALAVKTDGSSMASLLDQIKSTSGCRLLVADRRSSIISFLGDDAAMSMAMDLVKQAITQMQSNISTILLPDTRVIPRIVGSGGQTIQRIRRETDCEVFIDDAKPEIRLYGTADARQFAEEQIQTILSKNTANSTVASHANDL